MNALEAGALHLAATDRVFDDLFAPRPLQGVTDVYKRQALGHHAASRDCAPSSKPSRSR